MDLDLLPKILLTYSFIVFFIVIYRLLFRESILKARHESFKKHGFKKKTVMEGIYGILLGPVILYISSDYLYFSPFWKFLAFLGLIIRIGMVASIPIRKPQWPENNDKPSKERMAYTLMNSRNHNITGAVTCFIILIAWLKTFPLVQTSLIENNEFLITVILFILRISSLILLSKISYVKYKELKDA